MASVYPKILIVGQYFDRKSGSGITMTNLFTGWDKKKIAAAACEISNPDFSVCENYYNIGNLEIEREFPFNLKFVEEHSKSGILLNNTADKGITATLKKTESKLGRIKDQLLLITGQIHRRRRFILSKELLSWIDEFSPDIIYSQLSSLELIDFISKIQKKIHKPFVLHLMDDWPTTITNRQIGIFRFYWSQLINRELRLLIKKADVLMSISESMSDEYLVRYNKKFIPFHNPIDVEFWTPKQSKNYSFQGKFKILYAGRIGTGLQTCLLEMATAIQNQVNKGLEIEFHIQATMDHPVLSELKKFDFIVLRNQVPYNQLPEVFSTVDLLLLPNDFDEKSISFLKYSMPTKASEYMVSGTPILVYSSSVTAITKHAIKYDWAFVVSENSIEMLENGIDQLYKNEALRKQLGCRAKEFAIKHFDSNKIRNEFKTALLKPIEAKYN